MKNDVFGIGENQQVTPEMARDALVTCFIGAHKGNLEIGEEVDRETVAKLITTTVRKAFEDTGGDFDRPTKESLFKAAGHLKEFSTSFRDQETIAKHFQAIQAIFDRIDG